MQQFILQQQPVVFFVIEQPVKFVLVGIREQLQQQLFVVQQQLLKFLLLIQFIEHVGVFVIIIVLVKPLVLVLIEQREQFLFVELFQFVQLLKQLFVVLVLLIIVEQRLGIHVIKLLIQQQQFGVHLPASHTNSRQQAP